MTIIVDSPPVLKGFEIVFDSSVHVDLKFSEEVKVAKNKPQSVTLNGIALRHKETVQSNSGDPIVRMTGDGLEQLRDNMQHELKFDRASFVDDDFENPLANNNPLQIVNSNESRDSQQPSLKFAELNHESGELIIEFIPSIPRTARWQKKLLNQLRFLSDGGPEYSLRNKQLEIESSDKGLKIPLAETDLSFLRDSLGDNLRLGFKPTRQGSRVEWKYDPISLKLVPEYQPLGTKQVDLVKPWNDEGYANYAVKTEFKKQYPEELITISLEGEPILKDYEYQRIGDIDFDRPDPNKIDVEVWAESGSSSEIALLSFPKVRKNGQDPPPLAGVIQFFQPDKLEIEKLDLRKLLDERVTEQVSEREIVKHHVELKLPDTPAIAYEIEQRNRDLNSGYLELVIREPEFELGSQQPSGFGEDEIQVLRQALGRVELRNMGFEPIKNKATDIVELTAHVAAMVKVEGVEAKSLNDLLVKIRVADGEKARRPDWISDELADELLLLEKYLQSGGEIQFKFDCQLMKRLSPSDSREHGLEDRSESKPVPYIVIFESE